VFQTVSINVRDNQDLFKLGIELALKQQELIFKEVALLIKHKMVANSEFIRYAVLNSYPENVKYLSATNTLARYVENKNCGI
jgi:hypothetical protein